MDGAGGAVRRDRPRRDAARDRRLRDLPRAALARRVDAGTDADGTRRDRGPDLGARHGRRRLPGQAVRVQRAARAAAGDRPARAGGAADRAPRRRPAARSRRPTAPGAATRSSTSPPRSSCSSRSSCAGPGEALSRVQLLDAAWDIAFESHSNVVDVYVRYLREKIDRPFAERSLETVRGVGYRLSETADMSRLPIRIRLTLPFAVAMAAVLAALGGFVYLRVGSTLLSSTDQTCSPRPRRQRCASTGASRRSTSTLRAASGSPRCSTRAARSCSRSPPGCRRSSTSGRRARVAGGGSLRAEHRRHGSERAVAPARDPGHSRRLAPCARSRELARRSRASRSSGFARSSSSPRPLALLLAALAGYALAGAALRPVEEMRRKAANISAATPGSRLPVPVGEGRDPAPRRDAERHARAARDRVRARAALRRRREPRAPHAALTAQDRARAGASPSAVAGRARGCTSLGRRGDRPPDCARRRPAPDRPVRSRAACPSTPSRSTPATCSPPWRERFSAAPPSSGGGSRSRDDDVAFEGDPKRVEQALGNLVENGLVHGAGTVTLRRSRRDQRVELTCPTRGPGFPEGSRRARSTGSAAPTRRAPKRQRARPRDRRGDRASARREPRASARAPTSGSRCRSGTESRRAKAAALAYFESLSSADWSDCSNACSCRSRPRRAGRSRSGRVRNSCRR